MILQAIGAGNIYGYTVMAVTGLASGTVYPALRRLERDRLIRSQWERQSPAGAALRPARNYYKLKPRWRPHESAIRCWQSWRPRRRFNTNEAPAELHHPACGIFLNTRRSARRLAYGLAIGALVYPAAVRNGVLPGRFPGRALGEAE
jgi:hypothetical protein